VTLLIAPAAAVLGLIATFVVIRARYREKESLYETLREERQKQIQQARLRAMGEPNTAATRPPAPAEPVGAVESSRPDDPPSGLADVRAQTIRRDRLSNVTGIIALVVSLVLVLLGVLLAVAQTH
jgi:hypothetical protein